MSTDQHNLRFADIARLVHGDGTGRMCIGDTSHRKGDWANRWFAYPEELDQAAGYAQRLCEGRRSTFSPAVLFTRDERSKDAVVPLVRVLICDLDTCDPRLLLVEPNILLQTSPDHYQAVWLLDEPVSPDVAQRYNFRIAAYHKDSGADMCHDPEHFLRLTLGRNVKPKYRNEDGTFPDVEVLQCNEIRHSLSEFDVYPQVADLPQGGVDDVELPDLIAAENPLPAWVSGILGEDWSKDTSGESWRMVRRGMALGYPYGLLRSYIRISGLFQQKYEGRIEAEEERLFNNARYGTLKQPGHNHPDQDCWVANCPNPDGEEPPYVYSNMTFTIKTDADEDSWSPVNMSTVVSGKFVRPEPTLGARSDGVAILYRAKEHLVISETEAGKTWFALMIVADCLLNGLPVVYIDFEDDEGTIGSRLLELGVPPEAISDPNLFRYVRPATPVTPEKLAKLLSNHPVLVALDGVTEAYGLHGWSIKENDDVALYRMALIKPCLRAGAATLALDHVVKDPNSRGKYAIGGVHKTNGLTGAQFTLKNKEPFGMDRVGRTFVEITKDRPGSLRRFCVNTNWFGTLVGDATNGYMDLKFHAPNAKEQDQVEDDDRAWAFRVFGAQTPTRAEMRNALMEDFDISQSRAYERITEMLENGSLEIAGGTNSRPTYRVMPPDEGAPE